MRRLSTLILGILLAQPAGAEPFKAGNLDAMSAMLGRTSVRAFDAARPVTDGELRKIMDAGYRSQTLDGSRPFEFVQIRDRQTLQAIGESGKYAGWMAQAPAAIAIVVRSAETQFQRENGAIAMLNMSYKAQELGLGTCFLGTRNNNKMKKVLGIGKGRHLLTVIPVGAPKPDQRLQSPKRYPLEWTVSQGRYGAALDPKLLEAKPAGQSGKPMASFLAGLHRKVEQFDPGRSVEPAKLKTALEAMRHAPSSKNKQHWRWVLVTDPGARKQVARAAGDKQLAGAPVVAVLAGSQDSRPFINPKGWGRRRTSPTFINHGSAMALRNLQIGAESQGLGVRVKGLSARGDRRLRTMLAPDGQRLSGKRVHFIAAVGLGYASKVSTQKVGAIPSSRIIRERY